MPARRRGSLRELLTEAIFPAAFIRSSPGESIVQMQTSNLGSKTVAIQEDSSLTIYKIKSIFFESCFLANE